MTTMNHPVDFQLTAIEADQQNGSLWSLIMGNLTSLVGKAWNYLNEDMGPVDMDDNNQPTGGCCS